MGFVCPNVSCRRIFAKPLKTYIVGVSKEPYDACPFCLTEIPKTAVPDQLVPSEQEDEKEKDLPKQSEFASAPPDCKREFGYLGRRAAKEQIPDECLTCQVLMQCMRKTPS